MKTIHIITNYFYPVEGGIEKSILETYSCLSKDEFRVILHTSRDSYDKKDVYKKLEIVNGIEVRRYKSFWYSFWPRIDWDEADVINLHNFNIFPHILIMLFALWRKINLNKNFELILHPHGGYMPKWEEFEGLSALIKQAYHMSLGKWLINLAVDRVRAVSTWEAETMRTLGAGKNFEIIPTGISDKTLENPGFNLKNDFKEQVKKFGRYILLVGKIDQKKNHKTVIKALKKIPKDIKLVIAGKKCDEDYFQELYREINSLGLEDRVIALGYVSEAEKQYLISRSLLMVHIPNNECYGLAAREAMTVGALMIVSKNTGMEEIQGPTSVDPKSTTELVSAINNLLAIKQDERQTLINQGRVAMKANSWEMVAKKMKAMFLGSQKTKRRGIKIKNKTKKIFNVAILGFIFVILILSLRGLVGNPSVDEFTSLSWTGEGPFESSNERGRYALLYSVVEDNTVKLSDALADFSTPDLARNQYGDYVSLFPPGMAYITILGYLIGKIFDLSQIGVYAEIMFFALMNTLLIYLIARQLKCSKPSAWMGALAFIFGTPAFAYAVSFFQHHVSLFMILLSIYSLLRWKGIKSLIIVFLMCGFSVIIDSANFFNLLPLGIFAFLRIFKISDTGKDYKFEFKPRLLLILLVVMLPLSLYFSYNKAAHGDPTQISGTLPRVTNLKEDAGKRYEDLSTILVKTDTGKDKKALNFFETRNLLNGLYIHVLSPDRGLVNYAPVTLLGVIGLFVLSRKNKFATRLLISIIAANVLLYSMWGDPYGGWAFGSRYTIPSFAMLSLGVAVMLSYFQKNIIVIIIFLIMFMNSASINTVGALTSSLNPPRVEVLALEEITGVEQKFTVERNWDYLENRGTKSFVYRYVFKNIMSPEKYYRLVYGMVVLLVLGLGISSFVISGRAKREEGDLVP